MFKDALKMLVFAKKELASSGSGNPGMIFFVYILIGLILAEKASSDNTKLETSGGQNEQRIKIITVDVEGAGRVCYKSPQDSGIQNGLISVGADYS